MVPCSKSTTKAIVKGRKKIIHPVKFPLRACADMLCAYPAIGNEPKSCQMVEIS